MLIRDLKEGTKLILQAYSSGGSSWVLDSGCINHMTGEKSIFLSYAQMESPSENIVFGDNSKGEVLGVGKISITQDHSISNVLYVDLLSYNLLSVSQLCEIGYDCHFTDKGVTTIRREDLMTSPLARSTELINRPINTAC
jgi:hypothetical protein